MKKREIKIKDLMKLISKHYIPKDELNIEIRCIILVIFPPKDTGKNEYFNKVLGYLSPIATQTRLHIDAGKFGKLKDIIGGPCDPAATPPNTNGTEHTWNYVYPLEKDKNTFSHPLKQEKDTLIKTTKTVILDIYSDIPDSAITDADTLSLGIKAKANRKKATKNPEKITVSVVIGLTPLGGGIVEVMTRASIDSKNASKLNKFVDIEIAYAVIEKATTPPATSKSCPNKKVITRARYNLELGEDAVGMKLVLFARWIYTKHEAQSGTFGSAVTCTVS